jgi:uncharacterized protein with PIN domain
MQVRFHLDEHIHRAIARRLRRDGFDVTTSHEAGLLGHEDQDQLAFAAAEGRVLVTHDHHFTERAAARTKHSGICYCHPEKYSIGELLHNLLIVGICATAEEMEGRLYFL